MRLELTGQQFGYWTVLKFVYTKGGRTWWLCRCACGTEREVVGANLKFGRTLSCGCYTKGRRKTFLSQEAPSVHS